MRRSALQRPDRFEQALLKGPAHAHGLSRRFHLGAQILIGIGKFVEGKTGHLGDDIVQSRFEAGGRIGQLYFIQRQANADPGRDCGNRIAGGFGGQGRGTGNSGVDFDQVILERSGIQRELDVAAAFHPQGPDQLQGAVPEHMVFPVRQGLGRADDDGVTCMDADRIQVLHVADRNRVVRSVSDHFIFNLFIAFDTLFDQYLADGRKVQASLQQLFQLCRIVREAAAGPAQGKGGPQNDRITDLFCRFPAFLQAVDNYGRQDRFTQADAKIPE